MFNSCASDSLTVVLVTGILYLLGGCAAVTLDPCKNHAVVTGPWRNTAFSAIGFKGYPLCDISLAGKWTRFTGIGGDALVTSCLTRHHCGSNMCGRMIAATTDKGEDVRQTGALHVAWGGICSYYSRQMEYVVCSGGFMVYLLPPIVCPTNYATYHRNCSVADCGPLAKCVGPGGCVCIDGYQLPKNLLPVNESYDCTDIDECKAKTSPCDPHSDCANTVGSYNCSCHPGFKTPNDTKASASNPCIDIDECVEEPGLCGPNADCLNTEGAHECTCSEGYYILPEGSMPNITNPCEDIDECLTDGVLELCGPNATCTNNVGSYICDCVPGFAATNPDNSTDVTNPCVDIEECVEEPLICGENGDCSNTFGWYICDCHLGYQETAVPNALDPCEDIDECLIALCGGNAMCFNTQGSYYCACKEGYVASTGFTWEFGVSKCTSAQEKIDSLNPPKGERPEVTFLKDLSQDLDKNPDIILPPGTVTGILSTVLMVSDEVPREQHSANGGNLANIVEDVSDKLMATLIEPTSKKSRKSVKTPTLEINLQTIGPALNASEASIPELNVKGNTMTLNNLVAIAEENNGSASAVLMSADGMEKLMRPSFFQSENVTEILSDVISATLPKTKYTELPEPFNFTVYHKKQFQAGLVTCVYWENRGEETRWSVDGCSTAFSNETHTICSCNHLSTFAVLLQTEEQVGDDDPLLEMVNIFCMCVGLAFLAAAILTFLLCRWNPKINNTARLHLCICLFFGHLLFLVGVSRTENLVVCAVIAGTLHFLFLASFVWMLLETLQLFLLVKSLTKVQVIQKEGVRALYLLLIGYGTPLVVVGVSAAVFSDGYGSEDQCWLRNDRNFNWSFIGPVASILSLNGISFVVIIWSLQPTLASMKSDFSRSRDTRLIIFKIVAQFFILGCTWILGFFQSTIFLKYLFIILNSQQGTFIFIVHCLLNKEVREEYKSWFSCLLRTKEPSGSSDSCKSVSGAQK